MDLKRKSLHFEQKNTLLESLKAFELVSDKDAKFRSVESIFSRLEKTWAVAQSKRFIDGKFFKTLDGFYSKLGLDKEALDDLKYSS